MTARTLPGIGLTGDIDQGAPWKVAGDRNWLLSSVLTQLAVESATTPLPASPLNGVIYIVPAGDANANQIAARDNGAWVYVTPQAGWTAYVRDTRLPLAFDGAAWVPPLAAPEAASEIGTAEGPLQDALDGRPTSNALAASDGATKIGAVLDDPDATPTDSGRLLSDRPSISNFDAPIDGVTPANPSLQDMANACDARQARFIYVPNWNANYRIAAPVVVVSPGVRIFGDGGGSYDRGTPKKGWLEGATGVARMLDLGASRTTGNPADNWQVDGISLRQATGVAARTVDGISFTSRTNGPDRGALVRSVSFIGLKDGITVENPDVSVTLATLDVQSSVFKGCESAINAKGRMFGLRFVGNQCEQNFGANGVIRGSIDGPVTIDDNILEGQPNPISIDIPPTFGNSPVMRSAYNYFEANSGAYVYRLRNSAPASYTIGPNYIQTVTAADYVLVQDAASRMLLDVRDPYPTTFDNAQTTIDYGSRILSNPQRAYKIRRCGVAKPTEVIIDDYWRLLDTDTNWTNATPDSTGTVAPTPYGDRICALNGVFIDIPLAVAAGDLVAFNVLCRVEQLTAGDLNPQIYNQNTTVVVKEWGGSGIAGLSGRWAVVSFAFMAGAAATSLRFRFAAAGGGTFSSAIAGVAARNFGPYANTAAVSQLITPVRPYLPEGMRGSAAYTPPTLAAGAIGAATTISVRGAVLGDFVTGVSFSLDSQGVEFLARVSAANTVTVIPRNPTAGSISLGAGTIRAMVKKG